MDHRFNEITKKILSIQFGMTLPGFKKNKFKKPNQIVNVIPYHQLLPHIYNLAKKSRSSKSPPEKQADSSRCQKQDIIEACGFGTIPAVSDAIHPFEWPLLVFTCETIFIKFVQCAGKVVAIRYAQSIYHLQRFVYHFFDSLIIGHGRINAMCISDEANEQQTKKQDFVFHDET